MLDDSQCFGRNDCAASQILGKENPFFSRQLSDSCRRRRFNKTAHEKIAAMNFKNESRMSPNRFRVIVERGLICCADLVQLRSGCLDYFANAKPAAYLYHFSSRDVDFRFFLG